LALRRFTKVLIAVALSLTVIGSMLVMLPAAVFANPPCGSTITASTTMTASIGPCAAGLKIGANGIVLNCAGFSISGGGAGIGIDLVGRSGVTVEHCKTSNFAEGIALAGSSNNILFANTGTCNKVYYYEVTDSNLNTLVDNSAGCPAAPLGAAGFYLSASSNNVFIDNTAVGTKGYGFYLFSSSGNNLVGNTANSNNVDGFALTAASKSNNLFTNTANSNLQYGYHDLSTGTGTKATGNIYNGDICGPTAATHNTVGGAIPPNVGVPPYLCTPQSP